MEAGLPQSTAKDRAARSQGTTATGQLCALPLDGVGVRSPEQRLALPGVGSRRCAFRQRRRCLPGSRADARVSYDTLTLQRGDRRDSTQLGDQRRANREVIRIVSGSSPDASAGVVQSGEHGERYAAASIGCVPRVRSTVPSDRNSTGAGCWPRPMWRFSLGNDTKRRAPGASAKRVIPIGNAASDAPGRERARRPPRARPDLGWHLL